jgi:hypothetical protein
MNANLPHYQTGGEVHAGDRVRYKGTAATVAFVSDGENGEFASGYTDYYGHEAGIMLRDDDGELTFVLEPDENLEFIRHQGTQAGQLPGP